MESQALTAERCSHCGSRVDDGSRLDHRGLSFCFECSGMLVSWYLDGGTVADPELFAYVETQVAPR